MLPNNLQTRDVYFSGSVIFYIELWHYYMTLEVLLKERLKKIVRIEEQGSWSSFLASLSSHYSCPCPLVVVLHQVGPHPGRHTQT